MPCISKPFKYNTTNLSSYLAENVPTQIQTVKQEGKTVSHLNVMLQIYRAILLKIKLKFCLFALLCFCFLVFITSMS